MTDNFPRTELRQAVLGEDRLGPANLARLLAVGYGDAAELARSQPGFATDPIRGVLTGRRLFAQPGLAASAAQAAQADPANAFARRFLAHNEFAARAGPAVELGRTAYALHAQRRDERALRTAYDALDALDKLIAEFPAEDRALAEKVRVLNLIAALDSDPAARARRLAEALAAANMLSHRRPMSADAQFYKADLLIRLGRSDGARSALARAAQLRQCPPNRLPPAYQALRFRLAHLTTQPATRPD